MRVLSTPRFASFVATSCAVAACVACVAPCPACAPTGPAPIPFASLANPVLAFDDVAIKDAYAVRGDDGAWHLGYSRITEEPFRFRVGQARTSDFVDFTVGETLDDDTVGGLASPDVVRMPDGRWVMTYNSHTNDVDGTANKAYWRTSDDLVTWSEGTRFVIEGASGPADRIIDAALAFTGDGDDEGAGAFLFFKHEQEAAVAHAPSGVVEGPWTYLGTIDPVNLENVQVLQMDGVWHLLGTTTPIDHRPVLHRLDGDPRDPQAWRAWTVVRQLVVLEEDWNTGTFPGYERANAAYLIDERASDGHFYLLYAGSTELRTHEGRGHAKLGLARSTDLVTWTLPGAP